MIPKDYITEWRSNAPWTQDAQVEQDLIISRALVEMFGQTEVVRSLAFRGATALYKLHIHPPARYSEDIDLVQTAPGPIGDVLDAVRASLDPWLGVPNRVFKGGTVTLVYRMRSEDSPALPLRLKIEINTREHFSVLDLRERPFEIDCRWFSGSAPIRTYHIDELLGTKLRALYQRKKGRDLFDLWMASRRLDVDPRQIAACFARYLDHEGQRVSRANFESNLHAKLRDPRFAADITPLLAPDIRWDMDGAADYVRGELLSLLPGQGWKATPSG